MNRYEPKTVEAKWQSQWEAAGVFRARDDDPRPKYYCLVMFPYPSGNIHMGHVRNYAIGDVIARYHALRGKNVLQPIGWDSFGLPAENAAIERGIHPRTWTLDNIARMRTQLKRLGIGYDWSREVTTCLPEYYRWNQWFFLKMLEKGLAYRRAASVNWCPSCKTVLANEQVEDGKCWRCDSEVGQKNLEQWFLKITAYADALLEGHKALAGKWPDRVLTMQANWIGRSHGSEVVFEVADRPDLSPEERRLVVFTTRADTLFGATFMVLAPEHALVPKLVKGRANEKAVLAFAEKARQQPRFARAAAELVKEGVDTGAKAVNPVNGEKVPIWVANYVLAEYGTGAIMAVPAHDNRDHEFARKYQIPIVEVIRPAESRVLRTDSRATPDVLSP